MAKSLIDRKKPKRTNHLLVIGIDKYTNGISPLYNAVRDAQSFQEEILKQYQFDEKNVTALFNEAATRANILNAFSKLLNELTEQDNLVFYYSGHGEMVQRGRKKRGYWIPYDAILHNTTTYLSNNSIIELFDGAYAHHIFGIVDSCFSGSLFTTRNSSSTERRVDSFPSRWLLTAGRLEPVSDGSLGSNSPFATALLTQLKYNEENMLWTADLCHQVLKATGYNTDKQTPRGEPLQSVGHQGGQFVFYKRGFIPIKKEENLGDDSPNPTKDINDTHPVTILKKENKIEGKPKTLKELKSNLKKLVAKDLKKALERFQAIVNDDSRASTDIIMQMGRYNRTTKDANNGLLTNEQKDRTYAQITYALTSMIEDLELEDLVNGLF